MKRKIFEWSHRILGFTIFQSFISILSFVGIYVSMEVLISRNLLDWRVHIGLFQFALAMAYLQIANVFYWLFDINILDFKLWRIKNETK